MTSAFYSGRKARNKTKNNPNDQRERLRFLVVISELLVIIKSCLKGVTEPRI